MKPNRNLFLIIGAAVWVTGTYDPATNQTLWGTGNPVPMFDPFYRPGDNRRPTRDAQTATRRHLDDRLRLYYLEREADALFQQGNEFGDNSALRSAIDRFNRLLDLQPLGRLPLQWAGAQNNLGNTLATLGMRESGTAHLEEAIVAFRDALKELIRERVPLQWAAVQTSLGSALLALGGRESGTAHLEEAVAAFHDALKELTRERAPLQWAAVQNSLCFALGKFGARESGTARLEEALAACQEAPIVQVRVPAAPLGAGYRRSGRRAEASRRAPWRSRYGRTGVCQDHRCLRDVP
jgi:tetratricopeptide (TPR) repeat protein